MSTTPSYADHQKNLDAIHALIDKQKLVEQLVDSQQHGPRQDLVASLVHRQHLVELRRRLDLVHTGDLANLMESLPINERMLVWQELSLERAGDVLVEVSDAIRASLVAELSAEMLGKVVEQLDADDLSVIADDIPETLLHARLQSLTEKDQHWVKASLQYPEDCVGALMSSEMLVVRTSDSIVRVLEFMRQHAAIPIHTDKLFVIDHRGILVGVISLHKVLLSKPETAVQEVMTRNFAQFHPEEKADTAARAFERYDLVSAPVVNDRGKLVGRLSVDEMMNYIRDSATEDVLNMAGMKEEDLYQSVYASAKNRWPWLAINLLTAFMASTVIGLFESTIAQLVALASLMPIIASIGGNTGNQTVALMIRRITLEQLKGVVKLHMVRKELLISLLNGMLLGLVVGLFAFLLYGQWRLSAVVTAAMMLNLLVGAVVGLITPLTLNYFGKDPALGSSILLTATTDSMGFFIFLGLASWMLL